MEDERDRKRIRGHSDIHFVTKRLAAVAAATENVVDRMHSTLYESAESAFLCRDFQAATHGALASLQVPPWNSSCVTSTRS
jgi:hypothetical protein